MTVDRKRIYHKRDRLRQLRAFCGAARLSSITQAAEMLGVTQPSVSLHVRELENELDTPLFDRSGPGVSLTTAGKRLYELAEPLVRGMDGLNGVLMDRTDEAIPERLHVAASVAGAAFVLPGYVKRLRELYPSIRLKVQNCLLRDGLKLLLDDEVECVLGVKDPYPEDSLEYHQMLAYDIVLITARDHPLAGRSTVSPHEAGQWPAIVPAAGTYSRQFGETAARQFGVDIKSVIQGPWLGRDQTLCRGRARDLHRSEPLRQGDRSGVDHPAQGILSDPQLRCVHAAGQVPDILSPPVASPHGSGLSRSASHSCTPGPANLAAESHRFVVTPGSRRIRQRGALRTRPGPGHSPRVPPLRAARLRRPFRGDVPYPRPWRSRAARARTE